MNEEIEIFLEQGIELKFTGKYRRDLEKENWHYYEKEDGTILHIPKHRIIYVMSKKLLQ